MVISLSDIKKSFGDTVLFENVTFEVDKSDKIGFVGVNGAGKTSLFKIITEELNPDSGNIFQNKNTQIGYLEQHAFQDSEKTVFYEALSVFSSLIETETALEQIHLDIEQQNGDMDRLIKRQHELSEQYEAKGGYVYKSRTRSMLQGLGFSEAELSLPVKILSGGQKTKIMLGRLLLCGAGLLLLDEPTNHLDINAVEWLEDFLKNYSGAFIVISHDRYFLDRVTNRTFELENRKLTVYKGSYSQYVQKKAEDLEYKERQYENTRREIARIEGIIEQQKRWNRERNIKTAESKQKMVDRLTKTLEKPESAPQNIQFAFTNKTRGGNDVLMLHSLEKSFDQKLLFRNMTLHITRGERVFLLGPNGCGKTTLFKIITGGLSSDTGYVKLGANIEIGYYDQTQSDLDHRKTVFDEVYDSFPDMTQTELRNALAGFLFKSEDVFKPISALSGGERARVSLLKLMLSKANLLLLDEPTNHLDIRSREALEQALAGYDGTLFMISHDRYFINKMANKIVTIEKDGIKTYLGNYDTYLEKSLSASEAFVTVAAPKENTYKMKKEAEAANRRRLSQISRTEQEIAAIEAQINELEDELLKPEVASDYVKAMEISGRIEELKHKNLDLYQLWERLQEESS